MIVMTTKTMERGRVKCHQYWEPSKDETSVYGNFSVKTTAVDANEDYTVASLEIKNSKVNFDQTLNISKLQLFLVFRLMKLETYHIGSSRAGPIMVYPRRLWRC